MYKTRKLLAFLLALVFSLQLCCAGLAEGVDGAVTDPSSSPTVTTATPAPATEEPTTEVPATEVPATEVPATEAPATEAPATEVPATEAPATEAPATEAPATEAPATEEPATEAPATEAPATEAPATEAPATEAPATEAPATEAPATEVPATEAPATEAPATEAPATEAPATEAPATEEPAPTEVPATEVPATEVPAATEEPILDEVDAPMLLLPEMLGSIPGSVDLTPNGSAVNFSIPAYSTGVYLSVRITSAGYLNLFVRDLASTGKVAMQVMSAGGQTLLTQTVNGASCANWYDGSASGTEYTVYVYKTQANDYNAYSLTASASFSSAGATFTGANSFSTAYTVTPNATGKVKGVMTLTDRVDYLKVVLSAPSYLSFDLSSEISALNVELRTETGSLLSTSISGGSLGGPVSRTVGEWLEAGTYYLVLSSSATGTYTVLANSSAAGNNEVEPNNSFSTAGGNKLTADKSVTGLISATDSVDYYYIHLDTRSVLSFSVRAWMDSLQVELVDSNNRVYGSATASGTGGNSLSPHTHAFTTSLLEAGDYYLRIRKASNTGLYAASFSTTLYSASLTADKTTAYVGDTIKYTLTTYGGTVLQTVYRVFDINNKQVGKDSVGLSKTFTFTPTAAGSYYVQALAYDGRDWVSINSNWINVEQVSALVVNSLNATLKGRTITFVPAFTGGQRPIRSVTYEIYDISGKLITTYNAGTTTTGYSYTPAKGGTYTSRVVMYDGVTWAEAYSIWVVVPDTSALRIDSVTMTAGAGTLTATAATAGGNNKIVSSQFELYNINGVLLDRWYDTTGSHTFQVAGGGTYTIRVILFDGTTWVDAYGAWTTVAQTKLSVSNVTATAKGGVITVNAQISSSNTVSDTVLTVYDSNWSIVHTEAVLYKKTSFTYVPKTSGVYYFCVSAAAAGNWQNGWSAGVNVNVDQKLTITSANIKQQMNGLYVSSTVANAAGNVTYTYQLYDINGKLLSTTSSKNGSIVLLMSKSGTYAVNVIAYDGVTWASKYTTWLVYSTGDVLTVKSVSSSLSSAKVNQPINFTTYTTGGSTLTYSKYTVYDINGKAVASSTDGIISNTFSYTPTATGIYAVEVVLWDGITWARAYSEWIPVLAN